MGIVENFHVGTDVNIVENKIKLEAAFYIITSSSELDIMAKN